MLKTLKMLNSPFVDESILNLILPKIRNLPNEADTNNSSDFLLWLLEPPRLTTYRINHILANSDDVMCTIVQYLEQQKQIVPRQVIPKVYKVFPETIAIECWPADNESNCVPDKLRGQVIVDAACGAAVLRGSHVFAPAMMGLPPDIGRNDTVDIYADISGKCKQGLKTEYLTGKKILVGTGRLKMLRHELYGENMKPKGIAVETVMPVSRIPVIDNSIFSPGSYLLQNLPSIICSKVLDPQQGEIILDMCASPGNKTSHLAEIIRNNGTIIALDKTTNKISHITNRCTESSITCVHTFAFDSTKAVIPINVMNSEDRQQMDRCLRNETVLKGPPFPPEIFDRILLDAPCSSLGNRPLLKSNMTAKMLKSYIPMQRKLFHAAVALLKKSGRLVYSTCTVTREECELMVSWALKTFPQLTLLPADPCLGGPGYTDCGLDDNQRIMVQRFGPNQDPLRPVDSIYNDTIGFFIACFEKK